MARYLSGHFRVSQTILSSSPNLGFRLQSEESGITIGNIFLFQHQRGSHRDQLGVCEAYISAHLASSNDK